MSDVDGPRHAGKRARTQAGRGGPGRRAAVRLLGWLLLLVGALLLISPDLARMSREADAAGQAEAVRQAARAASGSASSGQEGSSVPGAPPLAQAAADALPWLRSYNERVREGEGPAINDPFGFGGSEGSFDASGLAGLPVATLSVPAMGCEAPVYLGSSETNLSHGAAVVAGTSAPLGEDSSNCVIAAHRGMYFRWIENMAVGDEATLSTLWGTFTYRMVSAEVIYPSDIGRVAVVEGKDLLTLSTCHPYGHNQKRYIVVCQRVAGPSAETAGRGSGAALVTAVERGVRSPVLDDGGVNTLLLEDAGSIVGWLLVLAVCLRLIWGAALVVRRRIARVPSRHGGPT